MNTRYTSFQRRPVNTCRPTVVLQTGRVNVSLVGVIGTLAGFQAVLIVSLVSNCCTSIISVVVSLSEEADGDQAATAAVRCSLHVFGGSVFSLVLSTRSFSQHNPFKSPYLCVALMGTTQLFHPIQQIVLLTARLIAEPILEQDGRQLSHTHCCAQLILYFISIDGPWVYMPREYQIKYEFDVICRVEWKYMVQVD